METHYTEKMQLPTTVTLPLGYWAAVARALRLTEGMNEIGLIDAAIVGKVCEFLEGLHEE